MSSHALLQPHARVIVRGDDAVQVGLVRGDGVVLRGLTPHDMRLLRDLGAGADLSRLRRRAGPAGTARLDRLLGELRGRGLLSEATPDRPGRAGVGALSPYAAEAAARTAAYALRGDGYDVVAARQARHVLVHGTGELAQLLSRCLHEGGVGRLTTGDSGVDLHELAIRAPRPRPRTSWSSSPRAPYPSRSPNRGGAVESPTYQSSSTDHGSRSDRSSPGADRACAASTCTAAIAIPSGPPCSPSSMSGQGFPRGPSPGRAAYAISPPDSCRPSSTATSTGAATYRPDSS